MIEWLFWLSWIILFISAFAIFLGCHLAIKHGVDLRNYSLFGGGFIGLAVSGLAMTLAYGVPGQ